MTASKIASAAGSTGGVMLNAVSALTRQIAKAYLLNGPVQGRLNGRSNITPVANATSFAMLIPIHLVLTLTGERMKPQYFLPFGATLMIAATIGLSGCAAPRTPYDAKLIPSYSSEAVRYGNVSAIDLEFYDWPPKGETTRSGVVSDAVAMGSVGNSMGYTGAGLLWGAASGGLIAAANAPQRYPIAVFKVTVGDQEIVVRERMNRSEYRFAIGERVAVGNFSTKPFLAKEAEGQRLY